MSDMNGATLYGDDVVRFLDSVSERNFYVMEFTIADEMGQPVAVYCWNMDQFEAYSTEDRYKGLRKKLKRAALAAYGDSNDAELELLRDALDTALNFLGVDDVDLTEDEIEGASA